MNPNYLIDFSRRTPIQGAYYQQYMPSVSAQHALRLKFGQTSCWMQWITGYLKSSRATLA